jgi:hypothetical protein
VVAVVRKLMRAMWHLAREDVLFDSSKLFDTRRLGLDGRPAPRKAFEAKPKNTAAPTSNPRATRGGACA